MIVVRIELHSARTGKVSEIGRMVIDNVGVAEDEKGRLAYGDYRVRVLKRKDRELPDLTLEQRAELRKALEKPMRTGEVKGYPRLSYNVWRLISRAIRSGFPEEK